MTKSRSYCFTDYQIDRDYNEIFKGATYYVIGLETCPTTGRQHNQGFVHFSNARSYKAVCKLLPAVHVEPAKGTIQEASEYCKKENNYKEQGVCPSQGKRTDLDEIREILKNTNSMARVVEVAKSYQSVKMAEQILKYSEKPRTWKPEVHWYWGPTGTGKSREAYELLGEDCYTCLSTGRWFDGYDAHENVLIDDMRKDFMKFHELLRLLDRYAMRIETKGGTRQFLARKIIVTSCYHPAQMYETREDVYQLIRRIDVVRHFRKNESDDEEEMSDV